MLSGLNAKVSMQHVIFSLTLQVPSERVLRSIASYASLYEFRSRQSIQIRSVITGFWAASKQQKHTIDHGVDVETHHGVPLSFKFTIGGQPSSRIRFWFE